MASTFSQETKLNCQYAGECSGCSLHHLDQNAQLIQKEQSFRQIWNSYQLFELPKNMQWIGIDKVAYRDRADLTFTNEPDRRFGLYQTDKKEILDLQSCSIQSQQLAQLYQDFRAFDFPIRFGSFRLRVGPQGQRGVWLDFPNLAVKELFDEHKILASLLNVAHVEIGQRRKVLKNEDGRLRLIDPTPLPWFETYLGKDLRPVNLNCSVGDFTQPSMYANRLLMKEFLQLIDDVPVGSAIEVGSGIGNFTLALADRFEKVDAFEMDKNACASLQFNLQQAGLDDKVKLFQGDVFKRFDYSKSAKDLLFVDPPRSGFDKFFTRLLQESPAQLPKYLCYISCFAESFCRDIEIFKAAYELVSIKALDQFPYSPHYEILSLWRRK